MNIIICLKYLLLSIMYLNKLIHLITKFLFTKYLFKSHLFHCHNFLNILKLKESTYILITTYITVII